MTIGGIGGNANAGAGTSAISMNQGMDSYSKSLQKQIADAQKQLQELGQNNEMDPETKMKKRQEIQKQISDLNMQLRQHQMEERKKAQEEKRQKNAPKKSEENVTGLSQKSMEAMISAESSMKQAKVQGSVANEMQNEADIKRSEIKRDGGGTKRTSNDSISISKKWDDVEGLEDKAQAAAASQMSTLADADRTMREAAQAESGTDTKAKEDGDAVETIGEAVLTEGAETVTAPEASAPDTLSVSKPQTAEIGSNVDVKV